MQPLNLYAFVNTHTQKHMCSHTHAYKHIQYKWSFSGWLRGEGPTGPSATLHQFQWWSLKHFLRTLLEILICSLLERIEHIYIPTVSLPGTFILFYLYHFMKLISERFKIVLSRSNSVDFYQFYLYFLTTFTAINPLLLEFFFSLCFRTCQFISPHALWPFTVPPYQAQLPALPF